MLAETIAKPWAVTAVTEEQMESMQFKKRKRQSLAVMLVDTATAALKETNLSQFSSLSIFLCSLTGWSGLYFYLSPACNANSGFLWICMTITIVTVVLHILFILWAFRNIIKTKISEIRRKKTILKNAINMADIEMTVSKHRNSVSNIERISDEIHVHRNDQDEDIEHVVPTYKITL